MMNETSLNQRLQRILQRVRLVTDEIITFDSNFQSHLRDIRDLVVLVCNLLVRVGQPCKIAESLKLWLIKLEQVVFEADDVVDELSYEILSQKVRSCTSFKQVPFSFELSDKVENLNQELQNIKNQGMHFGMGSMAIDFIWIRDPDYMPLCFLPCLVFFVTFPKNFVIGKSELVQLWLAEGLVESFGEGHKCLATLASREIVQIGDHDSGNITINCRALLFVYNIAGAKLKPSKHYLYATTSVPLINDKARKLRTLILDGVPFRESWKLESLRALSLSRSDIEELPSSIGMLKLLRYLDVSNTRIKALPDFIAKLYNLQTLRFLNCNKLTELPRFNNLIHLANISFSFPHQMPLGLGCLTRLQTLSLFSVDSARGRNIRELESLNRLRGHLEITMLENVRDGKEAERANLLQKSEIDSLSFEWSCGTKYSSLSDEEIFEGLRPHSDIRRITMKYYMGKRLPLWMSRTRSPSDVDGLTVKNLIRLTLEQCWNIVQLSPLADLPRLKFLTILHMPNLECIYESYKEIDKKPRFLFPALESLSLSWLENLTNFCCTRSSLSGKKPLVFPHLRTLSIQSCAKLMSFPMEDLTAIRKIKIRDCNDLRFLLDEKQSFPHITSLSIEGCPKLAHLRNWLLPERSFSVLRVRRCEWLKFILEDLGTHYDLFSLEINLCKGLTFFSEEILCNLVGLRKLSIGAFSERLDDFCYLNQIKHLQGLEELEIWGSDFLGRKMSHLPDQLQHLVRLRSLKIWGFTTMEALPEWFCKLQHLSCLSLNYCWGLDYQSTTAILQRLSNLNNLCINGCRTLEENKSQWNEFSLVTKIRVHFADSKFVLQIQEPQSSQPSHQ